MSLTVKYETKATTTTTFNELISKGPKITDKVVFLSFLFFYSRSVRDKKEEEEVGLL